MPCEGSGFTFVERKILRAIRLKAAPRVSSRPSPLSMNSLRWTLLWIVVVAVGLAEAAPTLEDTCGKGDSSACLEIAERAFEAKEKELAVITAIGVCDRGDGEGCLRAAYYMDKLRMSSHRGKTSAQHRARALKQFEDCLEGEAPQMLAYINQPSWSEASQAARTMIEQLSIPGLVLTINTQARSRN